MIIIIIGIVILILILIIPSMGGGNPRYTLTTYKTIAFPSYMPKKAISKKWNNDVLPLVILNPKKINITMNQLNSSADSKKLAADIFEPPASLIAPCFYDEKTLKKYISILPKKFNGFWSFCGHDGGNLSQLCFLLKDYKLISSDNRNLPELSYARSAASTIPGIKGMNRDLDRVKAIVKNVLECNPKDYLKKDNLPNILSGKGIIADTYEINDFLKQDLQGVWIVKPVDGFGGAGIIVTNNNADIQAIQKVENSKPEKGKKKYIVCKYIEKPLLFKGRKTHLRILFLIGKRKQDGVIVSEFSVFPLAKIITAKLSYTFTDFGNKDIHDTHNASCDSFNVYNNNYFMVEEEPVIFDSRIQDGELPEPIKLEDAWKTNKIREAINHVMDIVKSSIDYNKFIKYDDCENAYRVYAPDIMLDEDYKPYLLEINNMPANVSLLECRNYNRQMFNWEMNAFTFPILKNIRLVENEMFEGNKKVGSFCFTQEAGKTWFSISVNTPRMGYGSTLLHRLENTRYAELKACYAKVSKNNREAIRFFQKYFSLLEKGDEYIFKY